MNEVDLAFYSQLSKNNLLTAQELHNGSLRHYQATVNKQIDGVTNGIHDNALETAATLRASQKPIMPDPVQS